MRRFFTLLKKILHFNFIYETNRCILNRHKEIKIYKKISKRYKTFKFFYNDYNKIELSDKVWMYWSQGFNNAPTLVKKCVSQAKKFFGNRLVLLDDDNLYNYIELPSFIKKKYNNGIISKTHFSDILRISLLALHGGLWLDSTVYITSNNTYNLIKNEKLFVYKAFNLDDSDEYPIVASSWLISCCKNNNIIVGTRDILYDYWKKNNCLKNYYLLHIIFGYVARRFVDEFDEVLTYPNDNPHLLMFSLKDKFNLDKSILIKRLSDFHKLDRRLENNIENSFYQKIITSEF